MRFNPCVSYPRVSTSSAVTLEGIEWQNNVGQKNLRDLDVRIDHFFAPDFFALPELWLRLTVAPSSLCFGLLSPATTLSFLRSIARHSRPAARLFRRRADGGGDGGGDAGRLQSGRLPTEIG